MPVVDIHVNSGRLNSGFGGKYVSAMGKRLPKAELLQEIGVERSMLDALLEQLTPRQMVQGGATLAGWTYNAHPLSMAAALANIRVMQDDGLIERADRMGKVLARLLSDLGEAHRSVGEIRSIGLFAAIELVRDRGTREPLAPYGSSSPVMEAIRRRLLEDGVFLYTHWHTLLVIPPLIITEEQLEEGFAHIDRALSLADEAASG